MVYSQPLGRKTLHGEVLQIQGSMQSKWVGLQTGWKNVRPNEEHEPVGCLNQACRQIDTACEKICRADQQSSK